MKKKDESPSSQPAAEDHTDATSAGVDSPGQTEPEAGEPQTDPEAGEPQTEPEAVPSPPKKSSGKFITFLFVFLLIGLSAAVYFLAQERYGALLKIQEQLAGLDVQLDALKAGQAKPPPSTQAFETLQDELKTFREQVVETLNVQQTLVRELQDAVKQIAQPASGVSQASGEQEAASQKQPSEIEPEEEEITAAGELAAGGEQEVAAESPQVETTEASPQTQPELAETVTEEESTETSSQTQPELAEAVTEEESIQEAEPEKSAEISEPLKLAEKQDPAEKAAETPQVAQPPQTSEPEEEPEGKIKRSKEAQAFIDFVESTAVKIFELSKKGFVIAWDYLSGLANK